MSLTSTIVEKTDLEGTDPPPRTTNRVNVPTCVIHSSSSDSYAKGLSLKSFLSLGSGSNSWTTPESETLYIKFTRLWGKTTGDKERVPDSPSIVLTEMPYLYSQLVPYSYRWLTSHLVLDWSKNLLDFVFRRLECPSYLLTHRTTDLLRVVFLTQSPTRITSSRQ